MSQRLQWASDGMRWPHRDSSRFVHAAGLRWHIQQFDAAICDAPTVLLIHGTGASTHSWRGLSPLLAQHFNVLAIDLPGHAFTDMPAAGASSQQLSLPGMAGALGELLKTLGMTPALVVGHSAGAAVAVRMCLNGVLAPQRVIALNGAFLPLRGLAGQIFSPVAKLMSVLPLVPALFSWRAADPAVLKRLIDGTGSVLDTEGIALYGQLVSNPGHAAGALAMMANWDLPQLVKDLPRLAIPLSLIVGGNDQIVLPRQAERLLALWSASSASKPPHLTTLPALGHLAHEEQPELVANLVLAQFRSTITES